MNPIVPSRRAVLLAAAAAALLTSCAPLPRDPSSDPPVVFVHGNGDSAALWTTTLWRFESNGWPRSRLHAIDLPYPLARDDDATPQPGRSSADEHMQFVAAAIDRVRQSTGSDKVVLVGNSRGGIAIRNVVARGGAAAKVSHAVLGGTPNHGVWNDPTFRPGSEFNGAGPVLRALNAPQGADGAEVTPGVQWMTLRSDGQDKFAQPDGAWIGARGRPTHVDADGPALKGALNLVLPARDHREVSFHRDAFAKTFEFIAGQPPATLEIAAEPKVVLDGSVFGPGPAGPTNLPLAGASVMVFAVDPATGLRRGDALHRRSVGADGRWGPFETEPTTALEFVVEAPGHAVTHVYRAPFPRSSALVHLRPERMTDADRQAGSVITFSRPRGYFGVPRDQANLDGIFPLPGVPAGVPGVAQSKLRLREGDLRPVVGHFNGERVAGRAWPTATDHLVILELHH